MRGPYINKWKLFEKLVTAIHLIDETNSRIKWNEKIYGRQFDVTIRTKVGFYDYLTVIECKNFSEPIPVKEVEAFVTKSRSVKADKAVIVSSSMYQSGAEEVARQNKIELFTLKVSYEIPENLDSRQIVYALNTYNFKLYLPDGKTFIFLPEGKNMLPYLIKHTIFKKGEDTRTLSGIMESLREELSTKAQGKTQEHYIPLQPGTKAISPIIEKEEEISGFSFAYELVPAKLLKGNVAVDPELIGTLFPKYYYVNVITKEQFVIPGKNVKIGFDTVLEPGKFYEAPDLEFFYYCERIESGIASLFLVESYQHGDLIQASFLQKLEHTKYLVEITDDKEISRLKKMYEDLLNKQKES